MTQKDELVIFANHLNDNAVKRDNKAIIICEKDKLNTIKSMELSGFSSKYRGYLTSVIDVIVEKI